jgi:hypothetical protein
MADYSIKVFLWRIRLLVKEIWDYVDHRRAYVDQDSPEAEELAGQWGAYKRRANAHTRFVANPKALRAWKRLTHDGRRFGDTCDYCGARETAEEREELGALWAAYPWPRVEGADGS